jgi:dihydrofolate reductase
MTRKGYKNRSYLARAISPFPVTELIDEYRFLVHPILLGSGKRCFKEGELATKLELLEAKTIEKGVIELHYATTK